MPPKMGRLGVYAVVSTALAAGVVVSAFHQRPNFYSACVYLAQSNLCLMILINLILLVYATLVYGLQRLCYGPLRPIEIEQLYEKGWFAVTETCLAMTIFREEVGAWFLVMFVALLTGKVWGWIGDGRVEVLEQQPPANPRLFHIRLSVSLAMSLIYDIWLMRYTINTVVQQARPNMMVMFLFEFAVLSTTSLATASRYAISLQEARIVRKQTHERLEERRREVRQQRDELLRQREAAEREGTTQVDNEVPLPSEDDVDELDIEVPGWEAKGQWVLTLDLVTDFLKLAIYVTFFVILMVFYGLPIHIIRDLVMTLRSFIKRLTAFLRYRRATQNMNSMYEDATTEDIQREDTCIICREEMTPWSTNEPEAAAGQPGQRATNTSNQRQRPKKLPCGHILHLGCLKSWLERQQVCPTCRAPVVVTAPTNAPNANDAAPPPGILAQGPHDPVPPAPQRPQMRMFNFGPLRLGIGQGNLRDIAGAAAGGAGAAPNNNRQANQRIYGLELGFPGRAPAQPQPQPQPQGQQANQGSQARTSATLQAEINHMEAEISAEIGRLQLTQQQLHLVNLLQTELARLRVLQTGQSNDVSVPLIPVPNFVTPGLAQQFRPLTRSTTPLPNPSNVLERHSVRPGTVPIPSGSIALPDGVTIPDGWTLLPLHRESANYLPPTSVHGADAPGPVLGLQPSSDLQSRQAAPSVQISSTSVPIGDASNNQHTPTPRPMPEQPSPLNNARSSLLTAPENQSTPASSALTDLDSGVTAGTSRDTTTLPSGWHWNDDGESHDITAGISKVEANANGNSIEGQQSKLPSSRNNEKDNEDDEDDEEDDEEDDGDDDEDQDDEETDESGDESSMKTSKAKGKAVSIEDVEDEDA